MDSISTPYLAGENTSWLLAEHRTRNEKYETVYTYIWFPSTIFANNLKNSPTQGSMYNYYI
jgi:hypothetical protein